MTAFLAQRPRRGIERLYRRHVGGVYRCALALLGDPADAAEVTRATFAHAYLALAGGEVPNSARSWLTGVAYALCRDRATGATRRMLGAADLLALLPDAVPTGEELARAARATALPAPAASPRLELASGAVETLTLRARRARRPAPDARLTCGQAERALSRRLDGALTAAEAPALHVHVRGCAACAAFDRRQRAQRSALRALASVPVPALLAPGGATAAAAAGSAV